MPDPTESHKSKIATPPAIAFVSPDILVGEAPLWTGHTWASLNRFLDDMDALGFAIWETPSIIYIFTGRVD